MKKNFLKKILIVQCAAFSLGVLAAQTYNTVDVSDEIYSILSTAELRGNCSTLKNAKPYTQKYINDKLDEIIENAGEDSIEGKIALQQKQRFAKKEKGIDWKNLTYCADNESEKIPITFVFQDSIDALVNGGIYNNSDCNAFSYEIWNNFIFRGDMGNHLSYSAKAFIGLLKVPMDEMGTYDIGGWWYGNAPDDTTAPTNHGRTINTYRNNAVIPYSYKKYWDGNVFYLSDVTNSGLEGFPFAHSMGYGMYGEIILSFLDGHIELGLGRYNREYGAMDKDSSLLLNAKARPFFGFDMHFNLFRWLSFSATTGTMESPKQDYAIRESTWPSENDSYYFQNIFSVGMISLDWKYVHFDFASSCIYPKRGELAYFFPIIDRVVSQDNIGDFDNLALHGDLKINIPKYASVWASLYLDEKETLKFNKETSEKTRNMFAYQFGVKANLPDKFLPYSIISFRYTKIEPYCYTHHAINYAPWYAHYISESYTNNGYSLGYYLPPNSDEFLLRLETRPTDACCANFQFQLTRHGADYGSRQIPGSSLYSELPAGSFNGERDDMRKYFLNDGAYEWNLGFSLGASYNFRKHGVPMTLFANIGLLHTWWTDTDDDVGEKGSRHKIDTDEYPLKTGVVMSLGAKFFGE